MTRWGMVVDLQKCVGCQTCTALCKQTNNLPSKVAWRRVANCEIGNGAQKHSFYLPLNCMQCSEAPCLEVCPTRATFRWMDGIVDIDSTLCVGCGYCIVACPYLARTIVHGSESFAIENSGAGTDLTNSTLSGICTKCNFCRPRVEAGLARALRPGIDAEASPVCVSFCIADALYFGDLDDPGSAVSRLIQENNVFRLQEELGTKPSVFYMNGPRARTESETAITELVPSKVQTAWGWPATINFIMGGMGAALYLLSVLLTGLNRLPPAGSGLLAPLLAAFGFLVLMVEAGRPSRGLHLFRALHRSWMSREVLAGVIFIVSALLQQLWPHRVLYLLATLAAAGLIVSQGFIIYRARAITAWNVLLAPLLFTTSSLVTASGLALLLTVLDGSVEHNLLLVGLLATVFNTGIWFLYLHRSGEAFRMATASLRRPTAMIFIVGLGHLLPVMVLLSYRIVNLGDGLWPVLTALSGLALIFGGASQKAGIILKAGYLKAITLEQLRCRP